MGAVAADFVSTADLSRSPEPETRNAAAVAAFPAPHKLRSGVLQVLVVSPNAKLRQNLITTLKSPQWNLSEATSGADAFEKLAETRIEVLLLDPALPDLDANEFKSMLLTEFPSLQVLMVDPHTGQPLAPSIALGPEVMKMVGLLERRGSTFETRLVSKQAPAGKPEEVPANLPEMVGSSTAMQRVYSVAQLVARRDTTVLITGASGTGKDLVARAIHTLSPRRQSPFMVINCAAIPEPLLEAELFGYAKGAFTGALQSRIGRIQAAQGGTLFLDEIGDMPLGLQSKILRFLEQGEVQRLGSSDTFRVDVRVVAATNANLRDLVKSRLFREDLYYRLAVFPIELPSLKDRKSDILPLTESFLTKFSSSHLSLTSEVVDILHQHDWPGNVRELKNVIERASILVRDHHQITPRHILL